MSTARITRSPSARRIEGALAALKVNPRWARLPLFDRKGWRTMAFGEFAESVNERVEPSDAAEDIYVGLDDLDSGSLHIRRWGKGSDVIGTKLRFRKGDIIFGRRRAYQRKLAVAEVDGICSAHAMVTRAKPALVLPEFLPFLMMSDKFMTRAVEISVGSLSPTINWKTLKLEPFALPPLDQQRRIAEMARLIDEAIQYSQKCGDDIRKFLEASAAEMFGFSAPDFDEAKSPIWKTLREAGIQVIDGDRGKNYPKGSEYSSSGFCLFLSAANVTKEGFAFTSNTFIPQERDAALGKGKLQRSDIVLTTRGTVGNVAFYDHRVPWEHMRINSGMVILRPKGPEVLPEYVHRFLTHPAVHARIQRAAFGSAQQQLTVGIIERLRLPNPSVAVQKNTLEALAELEQLEDSSKQRVIALQRSLKAICNHVSAALS